MFNTYKLFPSVNCNADNLATLAEEIPEFAEAIATSGECGYVYANGHLIPYSFIKRLTDVIGYGAITVEYGAVVSPREVCGEALWSTFDEQEQSVVGHCLLLLIEAGCIALTFPTTTSEN